MMEKSGKRGLPFGSTGSTFLKGAQSSTARYGLAPEILRKSKLLSVYSKHRNLLRLASGFRHLFFR